MAVKRGLDEFDDVSSVLQPSPNAKIQGVLTVVSPMKKSRSSNKSYFDGEICDGRASMRLVGFDSGVRRKLADFKDDSIVLSNCEVKPGRHQDQLEVMVNKLTGVEKSETKFDVQKKKYGDIITLDKLQTLASFQRVVVEAKVVRVDDSMEVTGGKVKQDILIGDSTGTGRLTVWEEEVGTIVSDDSYRLSGMMVREFRGKKYISSSKDYSKIEKIANIGDVESGEEEDDVGKTGPGGSKQLKDVRVIGVERLDNYDACLKCSSKLIPDSDDDELGECSKCKMIQCLSECNKTLTAQLTVRCGTCSYSARVFEKALRDIAQKPKDEITRKALLKTAPFDCSYQNGIIQSASRSVALGHSV